MMQASLSTSNNLVDFYESERENSGNNTMIAPSEHQDDTVLESDINIEDLADFRRQGSLRSARTQAEQDLINK